MSVVLSKILVTVVCIDEISIEESEKVSQIEIIRQPFTVFLKSLCSSLFSVLFISLSQSFSFTSCVYFFCSSLLSMSSIVV